MVHKIESANDFLNRSGKMTTFGQQERFKSSHTFYKENRFLVENALVNTFSALDRFQISEADRLQITQEAVFLWTQAKLAQESGTRDRNNQISGYNLGAAASAHLNIKETEKPEFIFADDANRESDTIAIADVHAETSAIDRLKGKIDPLAIPHHGKFIDMVVITNAAPCGSCRNEIYTHATSDQALVFIINDAGGTLVNTISELFPTKFDSYDLKKFPPDLLKIARETALNGFPSRYQLPEILPLWGVVMETKNRDVFQGFYSGDDGFWSNSPTMDAISNLLQWGVQQFPNRGKNEGDQVYKERIRNQSAEQVKRVVINYEGKLPEVYPSGKERQQLSLLPEETEIIIIENGEKETRGYKTTRKDLLPGAFTA